MPVGRRSAGADAVMDNYGKIIDKKLEDLHSRRTAMVALEAQANSMREAAAALAKTDPETSAAMMKNANDISNRGLNQLPHYIDAQGDIQFAEPFQNAATLQDPAQSRAQQNLNTFVQYNQGQAKGYTSETIDARNKRADEALNLVEQALANNSPTVEIQGKTLPTIDVAKKLWEYDASGNRKLAPVSNQPIVLANVKLQPPQDWYNNKLKETQAVVEKAMVDNTQEQVDKWYAQMADRNLRLAEAYNQREPDPVKQQAYYDQLVEQLYQQQPSIEAMLKRQLELKKYQAIQKGMTDAINNEAIPAYGEDWFKAVNNNIRNPQP